MPRPEAEHDYLVEQTHRRGYASVGFNVSGGDIDPLFQTFRELIDEVWEKPGDRSREVVEAFNVKYPGRPEDSASFLNRRRVGEINHNEPNGDVATEDKDVLHFTPLTAAHARDYMLGRGGLPQVARNLIRQCQELHQAVRASIAPSLGLLGLHDTLLAPKGLEHDDIHVLRIIHYLGKQAADPANTFRSKDELAELHFDRSKYTAAVWESETGLVGAPGNNGYGNQGLTVEGFDALAEAALDTPIRHRSGQLKIFAGAGYNHLPDTTKQASGNLPLLLHGVTNDNPDRERDAVVLFINEQAGITGLRVPPVEERSFKNIRADLVERQLRRGGMVA